MVQCKQCKRKRGCKSVGVSISIEPVCHWVNQGGEFISVCVGLISISCLHLHFRITFHCYLPSIARMNIEQAALIADLIIHFQNDFLKRQS